MKVSNAIKGFARAGFEVEEFRPGQFMATKEGHHLIKFYRNGKDNEDMTGCYYLAPDYDPPYPHSLQQAERSHHRC